LAVTARTVAEAVFLAIAVGAELLCCVGIVAMDDVFARLHYLSAAGSVGPAALAVAVVLHDSFSSTGVKALLIVALGWTSGPVLTHAIGAVAYERRERARRRR